MSRSIPKTIATFATLTAGLLLAVAPAAAQGELEHVVIHTAGCTDLATTVQINVFAAPVEVGTLCEQTGEELKLSWVPSAIDSSYWVIIFAYDDAAGWAAIDSFEVPDPWFTGTPQHDGQYAIMVVGAQSGYTSDGATGLVYHSVGTAAGGGDEGTAEADGDDDDDIEPDTDDLDTCDDLDHLVDELLIENHDLMDKIDELEAELADLQDQLDADGSGGIAGTIGGK